MNYEQRTHQILSQNSKKLCAIHGISGSENKTGISKVILGELKK